MTSFAGFSTVLQGRTRLQPLTAVHPTTAITNQPIRRLLVKLRASQSRVLFNANMQRP